MAHCAIAASSAGWPTSVLTFTYEYAMSKLLLYRHYVVGFLVSLFIRFPNLKQKKETLDLQVVKKVVIIKNENGIGDFALISAFLREIRSFFSECEIVLVVCTSTHSLAERCPYIDRVIVFDCGRGIPLFRHFIQAWRAFLLARRKLRPIGFDLAIVPRWDVDGYGASALAYFSGARWRVAFSEHVNSDKALINHKFDSLSTHVIDSRKICHEVERSFEILQFLGAKISDARLEVWTDESDERFAQVTLNRHQVERDRALVAIAPGAAEAKRRWPGSRFAELACRLQAQLNAVVLLFGDKRDRAIGDAMINTLRGDVIDLVGQTTLRQTAALLRRSTIFIGNCSGPLHLAVAAGAPVLEISCHPRSGSQSHANSPTRFGPWLVPRVILQPDRPTSPCAQACEAHVPHCILKISVDEATKAALDLLETARLRAHSRTRAG
jgi:ADP-heptose:LPS heptosyltransferase